MPPKSKRKLQLEAARARKVTKLDESSENEEASHNSGVKRSNEPSVSDRGDERSESERREDPMSERRDDRSESEISSDEISRAMMISILTSLLLRKSSKHLLCSILKSG